MIVTSPKTESKPFSETVNKKDIIDIEVQLRYGPGMRGKPFSESHTRKLIGLTDSMWESVARFRYDARLPSETDAIRLLLREALSARGLIEVEVDE